MSKKKRAGKYLVFGVLNTIIGYAIYETLALTVFRNERLALASLVSGAVGILTGYYLHSRFTWRGREIGEKVLAKFFIWNIVVSLCLRPMLTVFFSHSIFNVLYTLAYNICNLIHLSFSYEFITSTGNFVMMMAVVMVVNFLIYDRFVFGKRRD